MPRAKVTPFLRFACGVILLCARNVTANELTEREIYTQARQATVYISTGIAQGSGFFVKRNLIVTNFHVIEGMVHRPRRITYRLGGQILSRSVKVVRGYDKQRDLAILEVSATSVKPLVLGDSDSVVPPDTVYVAGHPASIPKVTFTKGNISAIREDLPGRLLQFTAPISGGSSGGPVFDSRGEVIGVATWSRKSKLEIKPKEIEVNVPQNLNLAVPSKHLKALLRSHRIQLPPKPKRKADIIKQLKAATVHIIRSDPNGHELPLMSGFFVSPDQIATDFHVVDGSTLKRVRRLGRGTTSDDLLLAEQPPKTDKKHHLAILKIEKADVGSLSIGNSDDVGIGGEIFMVGDLASGEVSEGKISDILEKDGVRYFEFDAQVSPGSSGGPIVNSSGEVIAIAALKVPELSGTLKYAIPAIYLKGLLAGPGDPPDEPKDRPKPDDSQVSEPLVPPVDENLLQRGIKFYKMAQFRKAVEYLQSVLNRISQPKQRAEAHLYLGFSKWGLEDTKSSVRAEFREALRYNPRVELPTDVVGQDHPVFRPLLEEAREESTGTLTINVSPPETEIWIFGGEMKRRLLGAGTASIRLFKGNYAVEGILEGAHKVVPVLIKPNDREEISLAMPTEPPPSHEFELTLDLFSVEKSKEVKVYYKTYDASGNQLGPEEKKDMQLREHNPKTSTWVYHVKLPSAAPGGRIVYRIETDGEVIPGRPMQVEILEPPANALIEGSQSVPIKARVISNVEVSEVSVVYDAPTTLAETSPSQKLKKESSSNTYKGKIPARRNHSDGATWYYVTATNKSSENAISATRAVRAKTQPPISPEITVLAPRGSAVLPINKAINIEAEVESNAPLKEVRVYYNSKRKGLSEASPSAILENKSSDTYIGKIPKEHNREEGHIWFFVMATTEKGVPSQTEDSVIEVKKLPTWRQKGVWASHSWSSYVQNDPPRNSDWARGDVVGLAYLSEGKGFHTLGARLDFPYENSANTSAAIQWGPRLKDSHIAFAFLAGVAGYRRSDASFSRARQSTEITPLLGGSLKFYPLDRVVVDVTGSIKLRSENSASDRSSSFTKEYLHHYEMGIRLYISPTLNLKAGYGEWRIGEHYNTSVQIGLGSTF